MRPDWVDFVSACQLEQDLRSCDSRGGRSRQFIGPLASHSVATLTGEDLLRGVLTRLTDDDLMSSNEPDRSIEFKCSTGAAEVAVKIHIFSRQRLDSDRSCLMNSDTSRGTPGV